MRLDPLLLGECRLTRISTTAINLFMLKIMNVVKDVEAVPILGARWRRPS
jgi:hypothetical protein